MDLSLILALMGLMVTGTSAILGIWVGWDDRKPPRYAWALSILVLLSTLTGLGNAYLQSQDNNKIKGDLARVLDELDQLQSNPDDKAVSALLDQELSMAERSNPGVMDQFQARLAARGRTVDQLRQRRRRPDPDAPLRAP